MRFQLRRHRMFPGDFKRAYSQGSRARGGSMTVVVRPNGLDVTRMGLSVGKVCWKSAVRRNRVRRVFREAFRLSLAELPVGIDVVMIGSTPRLEPELEPVRTELRHMVKKALRRFAEKQAASE